MNKIELQFAIPHSHPCYAGHFPGNPLVPGALLLQWIIRYVEAHFPGIEVSEIKLAKFLHAVLPGDDCNLVVVYRQNNNTVTIECRREDTVVCHCKMKVSSHHTHHHEQS